MTNDNFFPPGYGYENQKDIPEPSVLDKLKMHHDISNSVICSILGISEIQLWKIQKNVRPLPMHYKAKLLKFLRYLEEKQRSD